MGSSARIDELRKKFDENPRRYFAPLANEYRKAGDLEQAIFICQEYLPQQPGHMSGHIVYGQALFELSRFDEARAVFETALSLDPENLIALRHLGDISRQAGDLKGARAWYQRVLEADPRNEEIAQMMLTVLTTPAEGQDVVSDPAAAVSDSPSSGAETVSAPPSAPVVVKPTDAPSPLGVEKSPDGFLMGAEFVASPPPQPAAAAEPVRRSRETIPDEELLDLNDLSVGGSSLASLVTPSEPSVSAPASELPAAFPSPDGLPGDIVLDLPDASDVGNSNDGSLEGLESFSDPGFGLKAPAGSSLDVESFFEIPAAPPPEPPAVRAPEPPVVAPPEIQLAEVESALQGESEEAFVTETMAELYETQGHYKAALEIYQRLSAQRPDDTNLHIRIRAVRDAMAAAAAAEQASVAVADRTSVPAVQGSGGPTIREFLAKILQPRGLADVVAEPPAQVAPEEPESIELDFAAPLPATPVAEVTVDDLAAANRTAADLVAAESSFDDITEIILESEPGIGSELEFLDVSELSEPTQLPELPDISELPEPSELPALPESPRATASPSDTVSGSIDALFSGADASSADASAATTLAEAFGSSGVSEMTPLEGVPAHRATNELSLDHVFKTNSAPRESEGDGFSFDQFFADDITGAAAGPGVEEPSAKVHASDDIAQFNNWLNGLKKT